jgi:hypothetical protein
MMGDVNTYVSTAGFEEAKIKEYIRNQEQLDIEGSNETKIFKF